MDATKDQQGRSSAIVIGRAHGASVLPTFFASWTSVVPVVPVVPRSGDALAALPQGNLGGGEFGRPRVRPTPWKEEHQLHLVCLGNKT